MIIEATKNEKIRVHQAFKYVSVATAHAYKVVRD